MTYHHHVGALLALMTLLPAPGCTEQHCTSDEDCANGRRCDLDTNRCYTPDVCSGHDDCTDPAAPVCDGEICQPCETPAQCIEKDGTRPLCEDGRCLECTSSTTHCTNADAPICNDGTCEPCAVGSTDCETPYPDRPVCLSGQCVQCAVGLDDCTNPAPICNANQQCVACANHQECLDRGGPPVCDDQSCVECTDSATHCADPNPICDPTTNTCRPCTDHAECDFLGGPDTGVCDWNTSTCMDPVDIIYVDDDLGCSDTGNCDAATPCCTIAEALTRVGATMSTILVALGNYNEITIHNQDVWIIGQPGATLAPSGFDINVITVQSQATDNTTARIEGFTIQNGSVTGIGVFCTGLAAARPTLTLRNNTIANNAGGGVSASYCTITLEANDISGNTGGGVSLSYSNFTVVNNMITLNGSMSSSHGGVEMINSGSPHRFHSNTVVQNDAQSFEGGISCFPGDVIEIVNTIAYQNSEGDIAMFCNVTDSWTTDDGDPKFVGGNDFHLAAGSLCIDAGDTADPPTHDFDGQLRDASPDIGADEYYP